MQHHPKTLPSRVNIASTAILFFARSPEEDARHKRLAGSAEDNLRIHRLLHQQARKQAESTGMDLIVSDSSTQQGADFAQRFVGALREAFARGYQRIIAMGSDCPELSTAHLLRAAAALDKRELVLGPSSDGGVWLLGLTQEAFDEEALLAMPWETRRLNAALRAYAVRCKSDLVELPMLRDLDDPLSLREFLYKDISFSGLQKVLLCLLWTKHIWLAPQFGMGRALLRRRRGRAPPRSC